MSCTAAVSPATGLPTFAPRQLAVLGAGAWGSCLARLLGNNQHQVRLWARDPARVAALAAGEVAGGPLGDTVHPTTDLATAVQGAEGLILAVPVRATAGLLAELPRPQAVVSCAKGFVDAELTRLSQLVRRSFHGVPVAALSGPNLAAEIVAGKPAAATAASDDEELAKTVQLWFSQERFRVYRSSDIVGVETCGAIKNVIALAAGMSDALGLGENTKAALVTRGLAELVRLGAHLGGEARTFYGLSGLGDLMATCAGSTSRNHQAGERLARGEPLAMLQASGITAEGLTTVAHVEAYARAHDLDLPVTHQVHQVVYHGKPPAEAVRDLMTRSPTTE